MKKRRKSSSIKLTIMISKFQNKPRVCMRRGKKIESNAIWARHLSWMSKATIIQAVCSGLKRMNLWIVLVSIIRKKSLTVLLTIKMWVFRRSSFKILQIDHTELKISETAWLWINQFMKVDHLMIKQWMKRMHTMRSLILNSIELDHLVLLETIRLLKPWIHI
jgi:hypothetical protein